jgi:YfiH family protein
MKESGIVVPQSLSRPTLRQGRIRIAFTGRRSSSSREALRPTPGENVPSRVAFLRQSHSARVVRARRGDCGEGDALWTTCRGLALSVVTADCVPIVIANDERIAVLHAGWRGIVAGIIPHAVRALEAKAALTAWAGPAIRGCCYEVGLEVAERIIAVSNDSILTTPRQPKPRVDLVRVVHLQLQAAGVERLFDCGRCTYCGGNSFWSFRRDGPDAGRNHSFAWLSDDDEDSA